jgi:hypothetical protein
MNNERYKQIIDEVYKNYLEKYKQDKTPGIVYYTDPLQYRPYTEEEFTNRIKTNKELSERWGLKIEEQELSHDERIILMNKKLGVTDTLPQYYNTDDEMNKNNIPTRAISLIYKDEKLEIYE